MVARGKVSWNAARHKRSIIGLLVLGSAIMALFCIFGTNWGRSSYKGYSPPWAIWSDGFNTYTCGSTTGPWSPNIDMELIKWDGLGNQLWARAFGGPNNDHGYGVWGDRKGNIYTCGFSANYGGDDGFVVKWDQWGNRLWNRTMTGSGSGIAYSLWGEGGYIYTCCEIASRLTLVKLDEAGNTLWARGCDEASPYLETAMWGDGAGHLYTCGSTYSIGSGQSDFLLVKWDTDGNVMWYRTWGGPEQENGYGIWGVGASIYTCGRTYSTVIWSGNLVLVKWGSAGNQIWNRTTGAGMSDEGHGVWASGNTIYTCGSRFSVENSNHDLMIIKWDLNGNPVWTRLWGASSHEIGHAIWGDGISIFVTGISQSTDGHREDLFLMRCGTAHYVLILSDPLTLIIIVGLVMGVVATTVIIRRFKIQNKARKSVSWLERAAAKRKSASSQREVVYHQPDPVTMQSSPRSKVPAASCPHCGQPLTKEHENEKFCVYCGKDLKVTT